VKDITPAGWVRGCHLTDQLVQSFQKKPLNIDLLNWWEIKGCLNDFLMPFWV
jgi:hypothetical protein